MKTITTLLLLISGLISMGQKPLEKAEKVGSTQPNTIGSKTVGVISDSVLKELTSILEVISINSTSNDRALKQVSDPDKPRAIKIGISLGHRTIHSNYGKYCYNASLSPADTTLQLDFFKRRSIVLSTELLISPFLKNSSLDDEYKRVDAKVKLLQSSNEDKKLSDRYYGRMLYRGFLSVLRNATFIGTVNLLTFQSAQTEFAFNKQVEGGLGLGVRLSDIFWIGATYEITNVRVLRDNIRAYENTKIKRGTATISELDPTDETLFINRALPSYNFKFIFSI